MAPAIFAALLVLSGAWIGFYSEEIHPKFNPAENRQVRPSASLDCYAIEPSLTFGLRGCGYRMRAGQGRRPRSPIHQDVFGWLTDSWMPGPRARR